MVSNSSFPSEYGNVDQTDIGDNTSPNAYPQPRQPGWGHNGSAHVIDPIYIWNQSGSRAYTWRVSNGWQSNVQQGREIFVNSGAKPGYSKYIYPHPFREAVAPPLVVAVAAVDPQPPCKHHQTCGSFNRRLRAGGNGSCVQWEVVECAGDCQNFCVTRAG